FARHVARPPSVWRIQCFRQISDHLGGVRYVGVLGRRSIHRPFFRNDRHRGAPATVCGVVASADYMVGTRANPTFLTVVNPDQPDPKGALTAAIYGHDRAKFGAPEPMLQGQRVCVTGYISYFRGRPEMILSTPRQLSYPVRPSVAQLR